MSGDTPMNDYSKRRAEAERRMSQGKALYTRAAKAALDGLPLAEAMTAAALNQINTAREDLAELAGGHNRIAVSGGAETWSEQTQQG
jgi:hypothetical protein